jgi:deazaflavin-dependent oxidoreductase (nitroreductase family)
VSRQNDLLASVGAWLLENGHRTLLTVSGGRFPNRLGGMPTLELHTVGRKSGQRRSTVLTTPIHDDRRVVLVASKGGHDQSPDWYRNLSANPEVEITMGGTTRPMHARTATPTERAELWPQVVSTYRGYAGYQNRSDREIPLVICDPLAAPGEATV